MKAWETLEKETDNRERRSNSEGHNQRGRTVKNRGKRTRATLNSVFLWFFLFFLSTPATLSSTHPPPFFLSQDPTTPLPPSYKNQCIACAGTSAKRIVNLCRLFFDCDNPQVIGIGGVSCDRTLEHTRQPQYPCLYTYINIYVYNARVSTYIHTSLTRRNRRGIHRRYSYLEAVRSRVPAW